MPIDAVPLRGMVEAEVGYQHIKAWVIRRKDSSRGASWYWKGPPSLNAGFQDWVWEGMYSKWVQRFKTKREAMAAFMQASLVS